MAYTNKQLEQYPTKAQELKNKFTKKVEKLRDNDSLTPRGKTEQAEELREDTTEKVQDLQEQYNQKINEVRSDLVDKAFPTNGDSKAEQIQFDDTVFRLSKPDVKSSERVQRLEQGSKATADAVVKAAFVAGDRQTINKYAELYPEDSKSITEVFEFDKSYGRHKDAKIKMQEKRVFSAPSKPDFSR